MTPEYPRLPRCGSGRSPVATRTMRSPRTVMAIRLGCGGIVHVVYHSRCSCDSRAIGGAGGPRVAVDAAPRPTIEVGHEEAESTPSPEAGRGWAFSQLVFNPGSFVSVRAGFAAYAREGETERDLRARVHSTVLADVEQQVVALRALLAMLRDPWTRARISGAWSRDCDRPSHVRA